MSDNSEYAAYIKIFPRDESGNVWFLDQAITGETVVRTLSEIDFEVLMHKCELNGFGIYDETTEQWLVAPFYVTFGDVAIGESFRWVDHTPNQPDIDCVKSGARTFSCKGETFKIQSTDSLVIRGN